MAVIIINHPENLEFKIEMDIKRNGYDGQFRISQNYEEGICEPDVPLEDEKIITIQLNVDGLKFLKKSVEELIENIKKAKKKDMEIELEADEFDRNRVFEDSEYDSKNETDYTNYDENSDMDQQSDEFWNQF